MNVIVAYMLKSNDERVVVNDYIENEPLSENNLDKTLNLVNEIRLSSPKKTIWLYTGYTFEQCHPHTRNAWFVEEFFPNNKKLLNKSILYDKIAEIVEKVHIMVDGQYVSSQRDITLPYRGSSNQRIIDVQQSLQKGKTVLWQT